MFKKFCQIPSFRKAWKSTKRDRIGPTIDRSGSVVGLSETHPLPGVETPLGSGHRIAWNGLARGYTVAHPIWGNKRSIIRRFEVRAPERNQCCFASPRV